MALELPEEWNSSLYDLLGDYILRNSSGKTVDLIEVNILINMCRDSPLSCRLTVIKALVLRKAVFLECREKVLIQSCLIAIYHLLSEISQSKVTDESIETAYSMYLTALKLRDLWKTQTKDDNHKIDRAELVSQFAEVYSQVCNSEEDFKDPILSIIQFAQSPLASEKVPRNPLLHYWNRAFRTYSNFLERAGFQI